jgi:hypothetical protein
MTQRTRAKGNSSSEVNHRKFECNYKELQAYSDAWSHKICKSKLVKFQIWDMQSINKKLSTLNLTSPTEKFEYNTTTKTP